ncbi:MAG: TetR/AcrR family transcriptional regulator [Pseudomonadota bacterium]|nr:TetR/AcrR family transcriptional regulator [Pseudomonadota bacterium]MEE2878054.1 TetR/AcrR family transcriptional regulator [Pseudomonadota bacterium]
MIDNPAATSSRPTMRTAAKKYFSQERFDRLERILDVTKSMLAAVGPDRLNIRDLARESQVSSATLYNRFGSKDNIISMAVIDHFEKAVAITLMKESSSSEPPVDRILHVLRLLEINTLDQMSFVSALMSIHFKVGGDADIRLQLYRQCYRLLLKAISEIHDTGGLVAPYSPELLAEEASDRIFGVVVKWSQGDIPDHQLLDRMSYGVLSTLGNGTKEPLKSDVTKKLDAAVRRLTRAPEPTASRRPRQNASRGKQCKLA